MFSWMPPATAEMAERMDHNGVTYFHPAQPLREVIMYAVPDCGYCRQARQYFSDHGIEYVEYNIDASPRHRQEYRRLGGSGTPLILIDGKTIQGFRPRAIEAALR